MIRFASFEETFKNGITSMGASGIAGRIVARVGPSELGSAALASPGEDMASTRQSGHALRTASVLLLLTSMADMTAGVEVKHNAQSAGVTLSEDLRLEQISERVWRHISYENVPNFGRSAGNGLLVITDEGAVLIDTPWNDELTSTLLDWVSSELHSELAAVIVTHGHGDCLGGLAEAHRRGASSYGLNRTASYARGQGHEAPKKLFASSLEIEIGGQLFELNFVGAGHTSDNIVVWIPGEGILFGGCLVRSATSKMLGYTGEADLESWPETIRALMDRYDSARWIVPGHGAPGGKDLLTRTLELLRSAKDGTVE